MSVMAFDTLKLARRLEAAGLSAPVASGVAEALAETIVAEPATRTDMFKVDQGLRGDIREVGANLRAELKDVDARLRAEMRALDSNLRMEIEKLRGEMRAGFATVKVEER
jgi:hypothetical protein